MPEAEPSGVSKTSRTSSEDGVPAPFERAKRQLVFACIVIAGGVAIAGSFDRTTGGIVLLSGWALAVAALHRLGRSGSDRSPKPKRET